MEDMNKLKYTYQLQQRLRERKQMREKKMKRKTRFEKMRDDFLDYCDKLFQLVVPFDAQFRQYYHK